MEIGDLRVGENLLDALFIIPCLVMVHLNQQFVESRLIGRGEYLLVPCNWFYRFIVGIEAGFRTVISWSYWGDCSK